MKTITLSAQIDFGGGDTNDWNLTVRLEDKLTALLLRLATENGGSVNDSILRREAPDLWKSLYYMVATDATESLSHEMYENLESDPQHRDTGYGVTVEQLNAGWFVTDTYDIGFRFDGGIEA